MAPQIGTVVAALLITTFTPPPNCLLPAATPTIGHDSILYHQWDPAGTPGTFTTCYPSDFYRYGFVSGSSKFYSPGVCPFGYNTGFPTQIVDETRALCCISGWNQDGAWKEWCTTKYKGRTIWAPGVSIRWKPTDVAIIASATAANFTLPTHLSAAAPEQSIATPLPTGTATGTATVTDLDATGVASPTSGADAGNQNGDPEMSTVKKVGLGIGGLGGFIVIFIVLRLLGCPIFCCC